MRPSHRLSAAARTGVLLTLASVATLTSCKREERRFRESPPSATPGGAVRVSSLQPGVVQDTSHVHNVYEGNAYAVSEGQRLFGWYNCAGCHANGGGGMGPALMDYNWIYGSEPEQIFASIAEGRANGMPSWKYRLTNEQIWQLVAYVRSLSGLTPKGARPTRSDEMNLRPAPAQTPNAKPKRSGPKSSGQD